MSEPLVDRPIDRIRKPFAGWFHHQAAGGILLFASAVIALVWANGPWRESYHHLWEHTVSLSFDDLTLQGSLHHLINDGLMAMFFFVVGLELKREIVGGELSRPRDAALPVAAGIGGMVVPALCYLLFNPSGDAQDGWGIPMATDIAFAIGLLGLMGSRVPLGLKVFLTTLAIADDLGAVMVIALFYTSDISMMNLAIGAAFLAMLVLCNLIGVRNPVIYAIIGIGGMWTAFLLSGIHATVAGVLAAFAIPAVTRMDEPSYVSRITKHIAAFARLQPNGQPTLSEDQLEVISRIEQDSERAATPLQRLERTMHPMVVFIVIPIFALANGGVELPTEGISALGGPVSMGVILGLVVGKPVGILLVSWLMLKSRLGTMAEGVTFKHLAGAACLAGIGFTMSLFVNGLAFDDPDLQQQAKLGILAGSLVSGILGVLILRSIRPAPKAVE